MKPTAYVVLLHGIGRTKQIMEKLGRYLTAQGYTVYNDDYQSTTAPIEAITEQIFLRIRKHCPDESIPIHFVGHSMGALIVRLLITKHRPTNLGRVVMLAPPNQGSCLVDFLKKYRFFQRLFGPAALELTAGNGGIIHRLPPIDYEVGIIAGDRSVDLLFSWFILPGKNDGKLTVAETKLAGMKDHIVLHATHPFMPNNTKVIKQTAHFLRFGRFEQTPCFSRDNNECA